MGKISLFFSLVGSTRKWLPIRCWVIGRPGSQTCFSWCYRVFLKASHVMRTWHAHAVIACSLHIAWIIQLPWTQLPRWCRHYLRHLVCPGESWESPITVLVYMSWTGNIGVYFWSVLVYRGLWLVCWVTDKDNTLVLQSQPHKLYNVRDMCSLDVTHQHVSH